MGISVRLLPLCFAGFAAALGATSPPAKTYTIQTIAGSDFTAEGGPALEAALSQTEGVAANGSGVIYVADAGDNRVRKITPDGAIRTVAGTGVAGAAGDGGLANAAQLSHPYGLAVDSSGNLYIADLGNGRVRKVSTDGTIQTVAGGGIIVPGNSDAPALSVQLNQPRNLALDPDGTLYISDFGANRVYRVSTKGVLSVLAGTGNAGLTGDNGLASAAQLNSPAGIASDSNGSVYIADSANNRIRRVNRGVITTVFSINSPTGIAFGTGGFLYIAAAGYFGTQFRAITGIASALDVAVDLSGNAYATAGQYVRKLASDGKVSTIAGSGVARFFGGDNGPAATAKLHQPSGIAVDEAGNWYIADTANNRIRKISAGGVITSIAGTGDAGSSGDTGPATLAQLSGPRSVAVDSQHNVYIADTGNNRVRKITPAGIMLPVDVKVNDPEYVTIDLDGSLYIADAGNDRIIKLSASGILTTAGQALKPAAVTVDRAGNVYVSEPTRVSKISSTGTTTVLDGLIQPRGLALTEDGDLFIAEAGGHTIRRAPASGAPVAIAGAGTPGFSGDGGSSTTAQLNSPADIVADLSGTLWVADSGNNRIRTLTPSAVIAPIIASAAVVHAATMLPGPIAPNEIITIFGAGFNPNQTQLLFDGKPATIFYADTTQINALAPPNLSPNATTAVTVQAKGVTVAGFSSKVVSAMPGIFTVTGGTGQAAASNEDGTVNSAANPAPRGSIVVLYATGQGQNTGDTSLKIGGYTAELIYAGPAPGFQGLMQINARVPAGFAPTGILPVVLSVGNATSQDGVTIAVR